MWPSCADEHIAGGSIITDLLGSLFSLTPICKNQGKPICRKFVKTGSVPSFVLLLLPASLGL